jgi:hypothetical protein
MIDRNILLQKLPPFMNNQKIIMKNQNVGDIIKGILSTHEQYKSQYDKISPFFLGQDLEDTCNNIFKFLKQNVPYQIEKDNFQTLRSPSSIISGVPADCKTYSLASLGLLDSLRRKGLIKCNLAFRFAGYNDFADNLEHVFCVVNPKTKQEIWVDPVLPTFNQKKQPSNFKDKNINMALVSLSGIGDISADINKISQDAASFTNPVSASLKAIETLSSLFANKPNANDWIGWDAQDIQEGRPIASTVRGYILNDGDSVQNEALNIVSYIKAKGVKNLISGNPRRTTGDTRIAEAGQWWGDVTFNDIANKLARGGFGQEATNIKNAYFFGLNSRPEKLDIPPSPPNILPTGGGLKPADIILPTGGGLKPADLATKTAGMNIWVILALAAGAIYAISKKDK